MTRERRKSKGMEWGAGVGELDFPVEGVPLERVLIAQWGHDLGALTLWRKSPVFLPMLLHHIPPRGFYTFFML